LIAEYQSWFIQIFDMMINDVYACLMFSFQVTDYFTNFRQSDWMLQFRAFSIFIRFN